MNKDDLKQFLYRPALALFPKTVFQLQHQRMHRQFGTHSYWANINNPVTFNERILRAKVSGEHRKYGSLVDKELVKGWASERLGSQHVIETYGVFRNFEPGTLRDLPLPSILKPTHSSGRVLVLRQTNDAESKNTSSALNKWLKINHYFLSGEPQYRDLEPKIICERLLENNGKPLNDYKIFCFHGKPHLIQVDVDRFSNHKRAFFDTSWNRQAWTLRYPIAEGEIPEPRNLGLMLEFAGILSKGFDFVRADFYEHRDTVYFGELTFHPESGLAPFSNYEHDLRLGALLESDQDA